MNSALLLRNVARRIPLRRNVQFQLRASSALTDLSSTISETVKSTLLDEASKDDSRLWKAGLNGSSSATSLNGINGGHHHHHHHHQQQLGDLYIAESSRFWPGVPETVQYVDPFDLAASEIRQLAKSIRDDLIGTDHPVLNHAASYFFDTAVGKKVRPMMVLLLSRALSDDAGAATSNALFAEPLSWQRPDLPAAQRRLAEISELIHTASLFHDDVVDGADTRRGIPAVHMVFGNKMAILAGDYLLARASISLARLRHVDVVETMSTVIEHLVRGEVMQMRNTITGQGSSERLHFYLRKNFYKTGSLMANSCKSAALLGEYSDELVDASYRFGKHVGMAFQLVDDVLDFEGTLSQLGKPALSDLKSGMVTAPVLFAAEEHPVLEQLIERKFKNEGDVDRAVDVVFASQGIHRTKELARVHAEYAMDAILELRPSRHRDALVHLANKVVARTT